MGQLIPAAGGANELVKRRWSVKPKGGWEQIQSKKSESQDGNGVGLGSTQERIDI